jgi:acetyl-CoA acetyltransferase
MKNIQNDEFKSVVGGGGNPAVEAAATAAGIAFAAATALAAASLSGLAAVGLGAVAIAAGPNINVTPTNVDAMGNSGGCGGKVICTELCRNGVIEHDVWTATATST